MSNTKLVVNNNLTWWLIGVAFFMSGVFEFAANLEGLRQDNSQRSAPVVFKVLKEMAIVYMVARGVYFGGSIRLSRFELIACFAIAIIFLLGLIPLPTQRHMLSGLLYYMFSVIVLVSLVVTFSGDDQGVSKSLVRPIILAIAITQIIEILFAPYSFYNEANLFGWDRRSGVAVIPTVAGLIGVVGFARCCGLWRYVSLGVVAIANSSISLICIGIFLFFKYASRRLGVLIIPLALTILTFLIASRAGLDKSIELRLNILADSIEQVYLVGPSVIGSKVTAKAIVLDPKDSVIVDSMYLQAWHLFGVLPGSVLLLLIMILLYSRVSPAAAILFLVSGVGFLLIESWILWFLLVTCFRRR